MSDTPKYLITIVGPTAIGKTSMAISLAKSFSSEILSADSRQFYKEMQIGTAVPSSEELEAIPHHFIQHRSIEAPYSVGSFEADALALLEKKFQNHSVLFLVGGSGLYVDAVLKGLDVFPEVAPEIREELNKAFLENGIIPLQEKLKTLDPVYYEKVDKENAHRLIRALEICIGTGQPYSSFLGKKTATRDFIPLQIGLTADRKILYNRINRRVDVMLENGLLEEAKNLFEKRDLNALQTVGYKELFSYLNGETNLDTAIEEIKKNTRRFAKRQLTWWRKNPDIHWFSHLTEPSEVEAFIQKKTSL